MAITLMAVGASAQFIDQGGGAQAEMVKERALKIQSANNAAQGVNSQGSGSGGGAAAPPPVVIAPPVEVVPGPRTISAAQQENLDKLDTDLSTIKPGSDVTDDQKQQMQADFLALSKGGTKPTRASLAKLSGDLTTALAGKDVAFKDQSPALIKNVNVLLNSGNLTPDKLPDFLHGATPHALESAGASPDDVQKSRCRPQGHHEPTATGQAEAVSVK